jgi:hypothetical protein
MDLEDRLRLRDLLLGDDQRRGELDELVHGEHTDPVIRQLADEVRPVLARLQEIADRHVPPGTPREALDYALGHVTGFRLSSVAEYCGTDERHGDSLIGQLQRLLAAEVQAGRLEISYLFACPSCGNVIADRDALPEAPFRVFCEHPNCRAERTIDPARADAVFINANQQPGMKNWL